MTKVMKAKDGDIDKAYNGAPAKSVAVQRVAADIGLPIMCKMPIMVIHHCLIVERLLPKMAT